MTFFTENQDLYLSFSPEKYNCPVPCQQTTYKVSLDYFHKNIANLLQMDDDEDSTEGQIFNLVYYYGTLNVEQRIESLDYDFGNFLVAAGGNLGLFLGLCCLSVLLSFVEFLEFITCQLQKLMT